MPELQTNPFLKEENPFLKTINGENPFLEKGLVSRVAEFSKGLLRDIATPTEEPEGYAENPFMPQTQEYLREREERKSGEPRISALPPVTTGEKVAKFVEGFIPFGSQIKGEKEWLTPETMMEVPTMIGTGALVGAIGKGIAGAIGRSTWFWRLINRERGLVVQTIADMQKAGVSEGKILRSVADPEFRKKAFEVRGATTARGTLKPKPEGPPIEPKKAISVVEPRPKEIVKPELVNPFIKPEAKVEGVKEPWEMTKVEWLTQPHHPRDARFIGDQFHHDYVKEALATGKPVPPEVLKDYPDLVKQVEPATIEQVTGKKGKGTPTVETPKPVGGKERQISLNDSGEFYIYRGADVFSPETEAGTYFTTDPVLASKYGKLSGEGQVERLVISKSRLIDTRKIRTDPTRQDFEKFYKGYGIPAEDIFEFDVGKTHRVTYAENVPELLALADKYGFDGFIGVEGRNPSVLLTPEAYKRGYVKAIEKFGIEDQWGEHIVPWDYAEGNWDKQSLPKPSTPAGEAGGVVSPPQLSPTEKDQYKLPGVKIGVTERAPAKTISQFTKEYKEGLGEGGFIKIGGVEKAKPKVVTPGTKDISLLEFPLTSLHVADRHPEFAGIIKSNIEAEQKTNNWILRYSDRISKAFDKVEGRGVLMEILGKERSNIRDLDLMIEGKKPIPTKLTEFVPEIKAILKDIKGEIIEKMKNDFADSLSPKQKEYLKWVQGGSIGNKPKYVKVGTIKAVDEALSQFKEMEGWGIQDYFPHIFKGKYKYLTEDGHIVASGQTAKQAKSNFEEYIETHPDTVDKTFMFVNDFYDLLTVRKTLNPELVNPLEYLGTRLSRKEFFRLLAKTENLIKEEIANAGVEDIPKVKVDMSGIASFQKGTKFSGHFMQRKTSLRGEEADPLRALLSYTFSVGRKLGLEDAKMASYAFADSLPTNMPNAKSYIKMQADNMAGRYNVIDKIFDETIGAKLGMKPFGVSRFTGAAVGLEAKLKLGYAPAKIAINRMDAVFHTIVKEGIGNFLEGKKLLLKKDPELMGRIEREGHLAGMEQLFAGEGLVGISKKQTQYWRPLGGYQGAEITNRSEGLAAGYVSGLKKFNGDKDAAWIYAIDSSNLVNGLYSTAAKPVLVRGPVLGASYQFKQFLNNRIRFMSTLTPLQWALYIPGVVAFAGTKGALLTLKSILGISIIGIGIDEVMERLNRKAPRLHRGVWGLMGIDLSAPASWQLPTAVKDWIGVLPRDLWETGEMILKGIKNNGWTDEQINDYVRQIAPVGYNVWKGIQILSEGVTREGTKVIYKGGKEEGVINLTGAKSVSQSQASDSARYMNQQRQMFLEKGRVLEDKLFNSQSTKEANDIFKELVELKNIQTPQEMQDFINGLRQSAKSRHLTEEARIFLTLPKALKKEEIKRRQ